MHVELRESDFDPWAEVQRYQNASLGNSGKYGATACFVGTMRDFSESQRVHAMILEHYPEMTHRHLEKISRTAVQRWEILDSLIIHRYGRLEPNDPIVLIAVWSAHRAPAFEACRFLIEELKAHAPFWKHEKLDRGSRWVEHNTPAFGIDPNSTTGSKKQI